MLEPPSSNTVCGLFSVFNTTHSPLCPIISHCSLFFLAAPFSELPLPVVLLSEQLFTHMHFLHILHTYLCRSDLYFLKPSNLIFDVASLTSNSMELLCVDPKGRVKEERTRVRLGSKVPRSGRSGEQSTSSSSTALVQSKISYGLVLTL